MHPCRLKHIHQSNCVIKKSTKFDKSNKENDSDSSDTNTNLIPITEPERVFSTNNSTKVPILNIMAVLQYPTFTNLPKSQQENYLKYRHTKAIWQTVTILGPASSKRGKYKDWVNVSNGAKSWLIDCSDAVEWHRVNGDIIPSNYYEVNDFYNAVQQPKT